MRKRLTNNRRTRTAVIGSGLLVAAAVVAGCGPTHSVSQDAPSPSFSFGLSGVPSPSDSATPSESATPSPSPDTGSPTTSTPSTGQPSAASSPSPSPSASSPSSPSSPTTAGRPAPGPLTGGPVPIIGHTASGGRTVALTFDDGPGPYTRQILAVLAQYNIKATFCEVGKQAAANPALVKAVLAGGHRLCDHSEDHPQPMHTLSHDKQVAEIVNAKNEIIQAGGPGTQISWFRAPGGDFSAGIDQIAVQNGLRPLAWTVDTLDWTRPGVPAIIANVQKELKPGAVILMHDAGGERSQSVAALKQLIPWLISQGYSFDFPAS